MRKGFRYLLIVLCFSMLFAAGVPVKSQAAAVLSTSLKVEGENKVKLNWKKKAVDEYRIYRADTGKGNYRLLAKISGKKKSYTDKTVAVNKEYDYIIKGYKKKNGKLKCVYKDTDLSAYTGLGKPSWYEYAQCDAKVKPTAIPLTVQLDSKNLHPSGVELYRKTGNGKYKKIKTIKLKKNQYTLKYTDRNVKKGKTYYYKLRYYKVVKGKKVYSEYSRPLKLCAVNYIGDYTMTTITKGDQQVNSLEFGLTSNKGNGTMTFESGNNGYSYSYKDQNTGDYVQMDMLLTAYSFDNKNWVTDFDKVKLTEGKTIYLRFQKGANGSDFYFAKDSNLSIYSINYSGLHYGCNMNFLTNQVDVSIQSELYH